MVEKKYEIIKNDSKNYKGITVYRIKALKSFVISGVMVKTNTLGGYIQSEKNLSHDGMCWVESESIVVGNATVKENAFIRKGSFILDYATICGNSFISNSLVSGSSKIRNFAIVKDSEVFGSSKIYGFANVTHSKVGSNATITNFSEVQNSEIHDSAVIRDNANILKSQVYNNAIIEGDANIKNSIISDNVKVSRGAYIYDSLLKGTISICCQFSDIPYTFTLFNAFVDDLHPAIVVPVIAGNKILGFSVYSKNNSSKLIKCCLSFYNGDTHLLINETFSDMFICDIITQRNCLNPQYDIDNKKNAYMLKNFLLNLDEDFNVLTQKSRIFKTSEILTRNFFRMINGIPDIIPSGICLNTLFTKTINYYMFGQLLGLTILNFISNEESSQEEKLDKKYEELIDKATLNLLTGEIESFENIIPYNKDLIKFTYDFFNCSSIEQLVLETIKKCENNPNVFYID